MSGLHGTAEILFLRPENVARITFGDNQVTEPLKSQAEVSRTIRGLCSAGLIEEFRSVILQSNVWQIPLPSKGVRRRLAKKGVKVGTMRIERTEEVQKNEFPVPSEVM